MTFIIDVNYLEHVVCDALVKNIFVIFSYFHSNIENQKRCLKPRQRYFLDKKNSILCRLNCTVFKVAAFTRKEKVSWYLQIEILRISLERFLL